MMELPGWLIGLLSGGAVLILREIIAKYFKKNENAAEKLESHEETRTNSILNKLEVIDNHVVGMRTELTKLGEQTKTVFSRLEKVENELSDLRKQYIELLKNKIYNNNEK